MLENVSVVSDKMVIHESVAVAVNHENSNASVDSKKGGRIENSRCNLTKSLIVSIFSSPDEMQDAKFPLIVP